MSVKFAQEEPRTLFVDAETEREREREREREDCWKRNMSVKN